MKILIVDDSKQDRESVIIHIKKMNKNGKVETDESNCLTNALKKIKEFTYDVIILDLSLPETDGIDTIKKTTAYLKKIKKDIPIIILTGVEDYTIGREAWSFGIKDFLMKDEIQTQDLSRALKFVSYNKDIIKKSIFA